MHYTVIDIVIKDPICEIYVASDAVNLKEDPTRADGLWYVDLATAEKLAVGDYIKIPDNV